MMVTVAARKGNMGGGSKKGGAVT